MRVGIRKVDCDWVLQNFSDTVYKIAISQMSNQQDANDIFQETFIKLVQKERQFKNKEHLKAWLIRVTINNCNDFYRRWNNQTVELDIDIPFVEQEQSDLFFEVQLLPIKYRQVIHLYYYEDYSVSEISKLLEIPEGTIKSDLYRARNLLKNKLENRMYEG